MIRNYKVVNRDRNVLTRDVLGIWAILKIGEGIADFLWADEEEKPA